MKGASERKGQSHHAGEQRSCQLVKGIDCCLLLGMCEALPAVLCPVRGSYCHSRVSPAEATRLMRGWSTWRTRGGWESRGCSAWRGEARGEGMVRSFTMVFCYRTEGLCSTSREAVPFLEMLSAVLEKALSNLFS